MPDAKLGESGSAFPLEFRCGHCRLIWQEDRSQGDSPIHHFAFLCPRCGKAAESLPIAQLSRQEPS